MSIKDLSASRSIRSYTVQHNSKPRKEEINMESYEYTSEESLGSDTNSDMSNSDISISLHHSGLDNQFPDLSGLTVNPKTGVPTFNFGLPALSANEDRQIYEINCCTYDTQETVQAALDSIRGEEKCVDEDRCYEIIDAAYHKIWATLERDYDYVMSRTEYAVFNYFQARHRGNPRAVAAQRLYWQHN